MKKTRMHILASTILCLSIVSCSDSFDTSFFDKEIEDPEFDISISGLPIGYINYSAKELFEELNEDLTVSTGTNDIISFSYSQTLDGSGNADFVSVDDQNFNGDFDLLASSGLVGSAPYVPGAVPGDEVSKSFKDIKELTKAGGASLDVELTSADFSNGTFTITLATTTQAKTVVEFTIPSLQRKDPNNPGSYNRTFTLNDKSGPDQNSITVDLNNYTFDFTFDDLNPDSNNGVNNIAVKLDATVTFEAGDVVSSDDTLTYTVSLNSPEVESAEGDFKQSAFNVNGQTFDLDFFNDIGDGSLTFENPILTLSATNEYGFPVGINLDGISTNASNNNILIITDDSPTDDNIEPIAGGTGTYAIIDAGLISGATTSDITLNSSNSNLSDLLSEKPTEFNLQVSGTSNPNSPTGNTNFFNVNNTLNVSVDVELPLHVSFDDVTFNPEPIDLDLDDDIQDNAKQLSLRVATKNTIPFNGTILLDFVDDKGDDNESNDDVLFSKSVQAIVAAPVGNDGFSTYTLDANNVLKDANDNVIEAHVPMNGDDFAVTFSESEIALIGDATIVKLSIVFDTDSNGDGTATAVKVKSTDQVRIDLALKGDLKINTNN
ncbi:hypothetical protein [Wenyingzhuangia fucanilytica]|nr:hypothetical protein [Wenyingzhuangia fucanilytica]